MAICRSAISVLLSHPHKSRRIVEVACFALSFALIVYYCGVRAVGESQARDDLARFEQAVEQGTQTAAQTVSYEGQPDFSNWSESRKRAYAAVMAEAHADQPVAILEVKSVQLKVPVYADSSEPHLDRGAGVIDGMAAPGKGGNLGIAGHRDGFFRVLQGIKVGDSIAVRMKKHSYRYRVSAITIVDQHDNSVLRDTIDPTLTLVTCYPFYYQGSAPQRFIVHGTFENTYQ